MQLSNSLYDRLKWFVLIFLPAFAVLAAGIGDIYYWSFVEQFVSVVNLVAVFLGTILQISNINYRNGGGTHGVTAA